jgi:hypothetical protein
MLDTLRNFHATSELVYRVALVLGGLMLVTVCGVFAIHQTFGLGGSVLTASGVVLVGMSIWRKIDVSVSEKGFTAKLEKVETQVQEARAQASKGIETARQATQAIGKLRHSLLVQNVQNALKQKGYKVFADGLLGPQTRHAIKEFQAKTGLPQSGDIDSETIRALQIPALE